MVSIDQKICEWKLRKDQYSGLLKVSKIFIMFSVSLSLGIMKSIITLNNSQVEYMLRDRNK